MQVIQWRQKLPLLVSRDGEGERGGEGYGEERKRRVRGEKRGSGKGRGGGGGGEGGEEGRPRGGGVRALQFKELCVTDLKVSRVST